MLDDAVGGIQDIGGGTIVLFQANGLCAGIELFKVEDILNGSPTETVDALVIVTHHADVALRAGEQADQTELRHAGILIFVHQQVAVFVLVELPHIRMFGQQLHGLVDKVVEIKGTGFLQALFIGRVDAGRQRAFGIFCGAGKGLFRADKLILPAAHLVDGRFDGQKFIVHIQLFVDRLHHTLGVVRIIDGKAAGIADLLRPAAQDTHTG